MVLLLVFFFNVFIYSMIHRVRQVLLLCFLISYFAASMWALALRSSEQPAFLETKLPASVAC